MNQTRRAILAGGGSLLCSGCLRLASDQQSNEPADPTSTPEQTMRQSDDIDLQFPSGVSETGVTSDLLDRHRQNLRGTSFRSTIEWISPGDHLVQEYLVDPPAMLLMSEFRDDKRSVSIYTPDDFETAISRAENQNDTVYSTHPSQSFTDMADVSSPLRQHVDAAEFRPTGQTEYEGKAVIKLTATSVANPDDLGPFEQGDTYDGQLLVTELGTVVRSRIRIEYPDSDTDYLYESTLSDIRSTSVSQPQWAETAVKRAPEFDIGFTKDRSAVRLELAGGATLDGPISVSAWEGGTGTNIGTKLEEGLERGDTVYLGRRADERLDVFAEPPSSTVQLAKYLKLKLWAGITLYEDMIEA